MNLSVVRKKLYMIYSLKIYHILIGITFRYPSINQGNLGMIQDKIVHGESNYGSTLFCLVDQLMMCMSI